jgi:hypothetical protein
LAAKSGKISHQLSSVSHQQKLVGSRATLGWKAEGGYAYAIFTTENMVREGIRTFFDLYFYFIKLEGGTPTDLADLYSVEIHRVRREIATIGG